MIKFLSEIKATWLAFMLYQTESVTVSNSGSTEPASYRMLCTAQAEFDFHHDY